MMKPCCLETQMASDVASCKGAENIGGSSGYKTGQCPASAEAAAALHAEKAASGGSTGVQATQPAKQTQGLAMAVEPLAGCCFSLGYGSMMKPCCLESTSVSDVSTCQ